MAKWIGVDFDGTLAESMEKYDAKKCGAPIERMIERVRDLLDAGQEVRIFTARAYPLNRVIWPDQKISDVLEQLAAQQSTNNMKFKMQSPEGRRWIEAGNGVITVRKFCKEHFGKLLPVTNIKEPDMEVLFDDRAIQVKTDTGETVAKTCA